MMITPTPRAITPQDIVRIYVPAASPEEIEKINGEKNIFEINNQFKETNGFINIKSNSNRNSHCSGENTPVRNSLIITEDDIYSDFGTNGDRISTSSSRRGSMSRKSPAFADNDLMIECTHMRSRKNSSSDTKEDISPNDPNRMKLTIGAGEIDDGKKIIMTSFEELAKKSEERMSRSENYGSPGKFTSDEEDFTTFYHPAKSIRLKEYSKYESDCNIQYKALSSSIGSDTTEHHRTYNRRQNSSGNESSPFESDVTKMRFFGAEEEYLRKNKSSDDSSPSPNSKSTPVNDNVPLLLSSPQNDEKFKFKIPITSSSLSRSYIKESPVDDSYDCYNPCSTPSSLHLELETRSSTTTIGPESLDSYMIKNNIQIKKSPPSKIPLYQPIKSPTSETSAGIIKINNSTTFDIGVDRRMATPIGGAYEFNSMHKNRNQKSKTNIESNKIRIKINQSQMNQEN